MTLSDPITIRLEKRHFSLLNELKINLSEFVREQIDEHLLDVKQIDDQLQKLQKKRKKLLKMRDSVLQCNTKQKEVDSKQLKWLIETKKVLEFNPNFLPGRINLYANNFGLMKKPTKKQFLKMLENISNEKP